MARRGRLRGRLTLRERQALRRGDKVYRNGISVDIDGMPIEPDKSQWEQGSNIDSQGNALDPTAPDYVPNFDDNDDQADDDFGEGQIPDKDLPPDKSLITGGGGADTNDDPGIGSDGFGDDKLGNVVGGGDDGPTGSILTGRDVPEKKYSWIDDDRIPSQAEIDYYAAYESGEGGEITQAHLDEIGQGEGGEGHTAEDFVKTEEEIAEDNAPENQPVGPEYGTPEEDPLWTHTDTTQWTAENQPTEEELSGDSLGTDTTPNELAGGSLMTRGSLMRGGKSDASSIGGGYGKRRVAQQSRKQMNLTSGRNRSILTS